jgi:hypothetical protein
MDHALKGKERVVEICKALGATHYYNPIGGRELYSRDQFEEAGVRLRFLRTGDIRYEQFQHPFVPHLSIIDVMMFNDKDSIGTYLTQEFTLE